MVKDVVVVVVVVAVGRRFHARVPQMEWADFEFIYIFLAFFVCVNWIVERAADEKKNDNDKHWL